MFGPHLERYVGALVAALVVGGAAVAAGANESDDQEMPKAAAEEAAAGQQDKEAPLVQLALLLDTSNSMDGLINQAKTQLWSIVGEFAKTRLAGETPRLEVALYEYGNDRLPASEGYLRLVSPLSDDLDRISEALFALTTDGGQEYCGTVIRAATRQLDWKKSGRGLRSIFIAGNEPFSQGAVDYRLACKAAADKGITVSTIFCGKREDGIQTSWEHGAQLAEGSYLCIDQDRQVASIRAPQDQELARLSGELNKTYLAYGDKEAREKHANRQEAQDLNAAKAAVSAAAARAGFKASSLYRNSGWDLVDAVADGTVKLEDLKADQLPQVMQSMSLPQRRAHLAELGNKRKDLQARMRTLAAARDGFVAKEHARLAAQAPAEAAAAEAPLAGAIRAAIQAQMDNE